MSKKVMLYSGGTDSWLIKEIWKPDVLLYVDMKTQYSAQELKRIEARGEEVKVVEFPLGQWEDKDTAFIPMRNMYLLMVASNYGDEICLGATKEDAGGSSDKDLDFLYEAERMLNRLWGKQSLYAGREIYIENTFARMTKQELLQQYLAEGGNLKRFKEETFSCYHPVADKECCHCKACFRKFSAIAPYDITVYSDTELHNMFAFVEGNVIHRSKHAVGRYFMDKENGQEVKKAIGALYNYFGVVPDYE